MTLKQRLSHSARREFGRNGSPALDSTNDVYNLMTRVKALCNDHGEFQSIVHQCLVEWRKAHPEDMVWMLSPEFQKEYYMRQVDLLTLRAVQEETEVEAVYDYGDGNEPTNIPY